MFCEVRDNLARVTASGWNGPASGPRGGSLLVERSDLHSGRCGGPAPRLQGGNAGSCLSEDSDLEAKLEAESGGPIQHGRTQRDPRTTATGGGQRLLRALQLAKMLGRVGRTRPPPPPRAAILTDRPSWVVIPIE
jgi:hypothetical protein